MAAAANMSSMDDSNKPWPDSMDAESNLKTTGLDEYENMTEEVDNRLSYYNLNQNRNAYL